MLIGVEVVPGERDRQRGERLSVEQAVPEPQRLSQPLPAEVVEQTVRSTSRGSALTAALVAVATLGFIGFAHQQSVARVGVPTWLDWARDTGDPNADPDKGKGSAKGADAGQHTSPDPDRR